MWSGEPRPPARRGGGWGRGGPGRRGGGRLGDAGATPPRGHRRTRPAPRREGGGGRPPWTPAVTFLRYRKCTAALLLDSAARWSEGEPRQPIEWTVARELGSQQWRIILSAGLTPENVARAVATARPYPVDVNSGVEAEPGRKDPGKHTSELQS